MEPIVKTVNNEISVYANEVVISNPGIGFQYFGADPTTPVVQISGTGMTVSSLSVGTITFSGGVAFSIKSVAAPYTIDVKDSSIINVTTSGTITLPSISATPGKFITICNKSTNTPPTVIVTAAGSDTIDGVTSITLPETGDHISLLNNGSQWMAM